jgi:hypothetical protein
MEAVIPLEQRPSTAMKTLLKATVELVLKTLAGYMKGVREAARIRHQGNSQQTYAADRRGAEDVIVIDEWSAATECVLKDFPQI